MAKNSVNFRIEWEKKHTILKNLGFGKPLNKEIAQIFYKYEIPYIPFDQGGLTNQVQFRATDKEGSIVHLVKYARKQHDADEGNPNGIDVKVHRTRLIHPLATSMWDKWTWSEAKGQILRDVDKARKKHSRRQRGK